MKKETKKLILYFILGIITFFILAYVVGPLIGFEFSISNRLLGR